MTRSPARMTTPPISESSTSQSSVTFVPRRFSIASTMVLRCRLESLNALVTWTWFRPSRAARSSAKRSEMSGSSANRPVLPDHLHEVAAGVREPVPAHVDDELDEPAPIHPRVRDEPAHQWVARDGGQQLKHPGPLAEPALLLRLLEGGDRVGPCKLACFRHRFVFRPVPWPASSVPGLRSPP